MTPDDRTRTLICKSTRCQLLAMFTLRRGGGLLIDAQNPCYINLVRYLSQESIAQLNSHLCHDQNSFGSSF